MSMSNSRGHGSFEPKLAPPARAPRVPPEEVMSKSDSVWLYLPAGTMSFFAVVLAASAIFSFATGEVLRAVLTTAATGLIGFTFGPQLARTHRTRKMRQHLYPNGVAATASIERTRFHRQIKLMGRNRRLFVVDWTFDVDGTAFHGTRMTSNRALHEYGEGDVIWVLYNPIDPSQSVEWPPVV